MRADPDAPTRERILFFLKTRGPQTASQLAKRLGITPMGARQHFSSSRMTSWWVIATSAAVSGAPGESGS